MRQTRAQSADSPQESRHRKGRPQVSSPRGRPFCLLCLLFSLRFESVCKDARTAARAVSSLSGHMCPYVSSVVLADECLRFFWTTFTSSPCAMSMGSEKVWADSNPAKDIRIRTDTIAEQHTRQTSLFSSSPTNASKQTMPQGRAWSAGIPQDTETAGPEFYAPGRPFVCAGSTPSCPDRVRGCSWRFRPVFP
ncbi:hypothetical protein J2Y66_003904 [Paenarthrobacter nitroguajacolicus]|nr:hypothetical protein [Paenarthrobacter nitroguajacolicus]